MPERDVDQATGKSGDKIRDKILSPQARRALAEAEERRRQAVQQPAAPPEIDGPKGPEPIRYGDWERKGIASDF